MSKEGAAVFSPLRPRTGGKPPPHAGIVTVSKIGLAEM